MTIIFKTKHFEMMINKTDILYLDRTDTLLEIEYGAFPREDEPDPSQVTADSIMEVKAEEEPAEKKKILFTKEAPQGFKHWTIGFHSGFPVLFNYQSYGIGVNASFNLNSMFSVMISSTFGIYKKIIIGAGVDARFHFPLQIQTWRPFVGIGFYGQLSEDKISNYEYDYYTNQHIDREIKDLGWFALSFSLLNFSTEYAIIDIQTVYILMRKEQFEVAMHLMRFGIRF
jgi:hypothetical protein